MDPKIRLIWHESRGYAATTTTLHICLLFAFVSGSLADLPRVDVTSVQAVCAAAVNYPKLPAPPPGNKAQAENPTTFTVETNRRHYIIGETLEVTIKGSRPYNGITLQARTQDASSGEIVSTGHFAQTSPQDKLFNCHSSNDTVTHWYPDHTKMSKYLWKPSKDQSNFIYFVVNVIENNTRVHANLTTERIVHGFETIDVTGCGTGKGCFRHPPEGADSCDASTCEYLVTFRKDRTYAYFEMTALAGWAAIGFSSDKTMGGSDVLMCLQQSVGGDVRFYRNEYGNNPPTLQPNNPLQDRSVEVNSDKTRISCRFKREISIETGRILDLDNDWYQLYAWGGVSSTETLNRHYKASPPTSQSKITLSALVDVIGEAPAFGSSKYIVGFSSFITILITVYSSWMSV